DPVGRQVEAHRCIVGALTWADANPGAGAGPGPQPLGQLTCSQLDQSHWTLTSPVEGRVAEATDAYASNVAEPPGATDRTSVMPSATSLPSPTAVTSTPHTSMSALAPLVTCPRTVTSHHSGRSSGSHRVATTSVTVALGAPVGQGTGAAGGGSGSSGSGGGGSSGQACSSHSGSSQS